MAAVDGFNGVHIIGIQVDVVNVVIQAERVRLHNKSALLSYGAEAFALVLAHQQIFVLLHPFLAHVVDENICAVNGGVFKAEPHLQPNLIADFFSVLIAQPQPVHTLRPRKVARDSGVGIEKVVGYKYTVVAQLLVRTCHIRARSARAGASLSGVEVGFVFIHFHL